MKILFVTIAYPKGAEEYLRQLNGGVPLSIPSNTFQWAIIEGLYQNQTVFDVVSRPSLCTFPFHFRRICSPQMDMELEGKKIGTMLKTLRLKFFTGITGRIQLKNYIKEWASINKDEDRLVVMAYGTDPEILQSIVSAKRTYHNLIICPIVTDLVDDLLNPIYKRSFLFRLKSKKTIRIVKNTYPFLDRFILLTKSMEEKIPEAIGKSIVVEGVAFKGNYVFAPKKESKERSLLYTGSLGAQTSIKDLVDAFMLTTNPNFRLIICGSGEYGDYIKRQCDKDHRIHFKGFVPREEAIELQKSCTAVINPRKPTISLTKYSFPSKTMEYLTSGTPMIGYKLAGIPEEYYQYYYTVDGLDLTDLANTITEVLEKEQVELDKKAKEAMLFIKENKSSKVQVRRIIEFLSK